MCPESRATAGWNRGACGVARQVVEARHHARSSSRSAAQIMADRSDILPAARLRELISTIDPHVKLDPEAEQVLQDVAEDFVENVAAFACELVKHREGEQLEAKDLQLVLEKNWNMRLPGVGDTSELKAIKKTSSTEVHRQRLQMVRRRGR